MPQETHTDSLIAEFNGGIVIHDVNDLAARFRWMGKTFKELDDSFCHYDEVELADGSIVGVELQFLEDHNVNRVCAAFPNWSLQTGSWRVRIDFVSPFERATMQCVQGFGGLWRCEEDGQIIAGLLRFEGRVYAGSVRSEVERLT